jgi:hypothetical protein
MDVLMKTSATAIKNAVATILNAAAEIDAPALMETEFVHRVVEDFGNRGQLTGVMSALAAASGETELSVKILRDEFRMDLGIIASGKVSKGFRNKIYYEGDRVVLVTRTDESGVAYCFFPESLEAVIGYALKLLVKGPYGGDLKQCQLKECERFFFVSVRRRKSGQETGRRPDRYCSKECMKVAHRQRATRATIERRQKLKEEREAKRHVLPKSKQEQQR